MCLPCDTLQCFIDSGCRFCLLLSSHPFKRDATVSAVQVSAYGILISLGVIALHDKYWATHTEHWWRGYPHQALE